MFEGGLPNIFLKGDELFLPTLSRVSRSRKIRYGGSLNHQDYEFDFVYLDSDNSDMLDNLLNTYGISIIGYDSTLKVKTDE